MVHLRHTSPLGHTAGFGWQAHHVPSIVHAKEREAVGRPSFSHLVGITRLTRMHSSTQRACEVHRSEPYRCEQRARRYDYRRQAMLRRCTYYLRV